MTLARALDLALDVTPVIVAEKVLTDRISPLCQACGFRVADYSEAKQELLGLPGVGQKVADCVLLFSLEKLEAFPIDVWMKRAATNLYARHFDFAFIERVKGKGSITPKEYATIGSFAREYFGEYAGYAQEYLFHYLRTRQHQ